MIDRERVLAKLDEIDGYLGELRTVAPDTLDDYRRIERKRSCERILQIAIEGVIEICHLLVAGLRLGLPGEENDLFEKLAGAGVISDPLRSILVRMRGFRNILVHEYGAVDDEIVFRAARRDAADFARFRAEVLTALEPKS